MVSGRGTFNAISPSDVAQTFEDAVRNGEMNVVKALLQKFPAEVKGELSLLWKAILEDETVFKKELVDCLIEHTPSITSHKVHHYLGKIEAHYGTDAAKSVFDRLDDTDDIIWSIIYMHDQGNIGTTGLMRHAASILNQTPYTDEFLEFIERGMEDVFMGYIKNSPHVNEDTILKVLEHTMFFRQGDDFKDVKYALFDRLEKLDNPSPSAVERFVDCNIFDKGVHPHRVFDLLPVDRSYRDLFIYACAMDKQDLYKAMRSYGIEPQPPYLDLPDYNYGGEHEAEGTTYRDYYLEDAHKKDERDKVYDLPIAYSACKGLEIWRCFGSQTFEDETGFQSVLSLNGLQWAARANEFSLVVETAIHDKEHLTAEDMLTEDKGGHSPLMILASRGRFAELLNAKLWKWDSFDIQECYAALPRLYQRIYADQYEQFKPFLMLNRVKTNNAPSIRRRVKKGPKV